MEFLELIENMSEYFKEFLSAWNTKEMTSFESTQKNFQMTKHF